MIGKLNIEQCIAVAEALHHLLDNPEHINSGYINDYLVAVEDYEDYLFEQMEQAELDAANHKILFGQPN